MIPVPGERLQRFVGDRVRFEVQEREGRGRKAGWRAVLRTNIGRAELLRREILQAHTRGLPIAGAAWRDLPMKESGEGWALEMPLAEVGYFKAKAYLLDPRGWQHWPEGPDVGISVHPDRYRTANILYCAFPRMFGSTKTALSTRNEALARALAPLDESGYTVIPPSGKLRDLTQVLPHIFGTLGCRILHLLPVNPTPTTYARFGRFGSPYAALDLTAIDPALVVFDKRTTGIDQFRELTYETHLLGGRVFLDIVINHTGWGSVLQENHPEWFLRHPDGTFVSPGAWGVTWEDLVELKHRNVALWDELSSMFLTWCRRGVDGFRCDAGYQVPVAAWQYIVARVQQEYPETIFLLEGLGGAWEATEARLTEGGLQWAYSELFQNYSGEQVSGYLAHSLRQRGRVGLLVHYSETHDNERLAARGRAWSLLRNRLCALASVSGGFGFTCGVEWLATEKILVHGSSGMAWGNPDNLLPELGRLNRLLAEHPCFFDGAKVTRLSSEQSPVLALMRESEEGKDKLLVLVNTDVGASREFRLAGSELGFLGRQAALEVGDTAGLETCATINSSLRGWFELLGQTPPEVRAGARGELVFTIPPGSAYCLAPAATPVGLHGEAYRRARLQAAWAVAALHQVAPVEEYGDFDWRALAAAVERSPAGFLAAISEAGAKVRLDFGTLTPRPDVFPRVVIWTLRDVRRVTPVPPGHWLLVEDTAPFRAALSVEGAEAELQHVESLPVASGHVACFPPRQTGADATLLIERYAEKDRNPEAAIRFLPPAPAALGSRLGACDLRPSDLVLLTSGRGGMARMCVDLGRVLSKYDCVLGANLHPTLPVDRHVFAKRVRAWLNADGFISPLDFGSLDSFEPGPPACWNFVANAGDGRTVQVQMRAGMLEGRNTTVFRFLRPGAAQASGKQLPAKADVRLTVRIDIEDRNFHWETKRNPGAEHHFHTHVRTLVPNPSDPALKVGFAFTPAHDRQLRVYAEGGSYHPQPEWSEGIPHPVEQSRGQTGSGDAYSPGWFELPLPKGADVVLVVTAEAADPDRAEIEELEANPGGGTEPGGSSVHAAATSGQVEAIKAGSAADTKEKRRERRAPVTDEQTDSFGRQLLRAARAFVVQRDSGKTVIAGYPWFLDWGRDTFICARGLLAGGMVEEVKQLLITFARFEQDGTLPNTIFGENASNRDTSDAPLWFGLVCEELAAQPHVGPFSPVYSIPVDASGRTLLDVLKSIATHYTRGTPNGIHMDASSGLIWSPSHFTWMDTNYPAGTPREGYPVEIQALWIRLLRQLASVSGLAEGESWRALAEKALGSFEKLFWRDDRGYYADVLLAKAHQAASEAVADDALRSNCLLAVSLGLVEGERAKRCVEAARCHLVVPGALRTLAPLPVSVPLPIYGGDGRLLNDPAAPYWGRYEGDEDTRRKPAYHNGSAWTWTFPLFCEALARAWEFSPAAVSAARAYLGSMARLMAEGCIGHIPELLDGDTPHTARGCDAQSWGATEALRVWKLLG